MSIPPVEIPQFLVPPLVEGSNLAQSDELAYSTAIELRAQYECGELSPVDVMQAVLGRIERFNGDRHTGINAFTEVFAEQSLIEARKAQESFFQLRRSGDPAPPLLGIPVALKEKHFLRGERYSEGHENWAERRATSDHPVTERLRRAGAILHGRTATPEFSASTFTHSKLWGITRNPWNSAATPGGSSGGAGAALAGGMTILATASDIGGSTRVPAGFCGVVGYKAPYGRVPGFGPLSADSYRGDGGLARSVDDMALLHGQIAGRHALDHCSWGPTGTPEYLGQSAVLAGMRIGVDARAGDFPLSAAVASDFDQLVNVLRSAGAEVINVSLPFSSDEVIEAAQLHFGHIISTIVGESLKDTAADATEYVRQVQRDAVAASTRGSYIDSLRADAKIQQDIALAMHSLDLLVVPTQGAEMLLADQDITAGFGIDGIHHNQLMKAHMTLPFNIANRCPVMAIPIGLSPSGVPTSAQLVGHPYDEYTVFTASRAITELMPALGAPAMHI